MEVTEVKPIFMETGSWANGISWIFSRPLQVLSILTLGREVSTEFPLSLLGETTLKTSCSAKTTQCMQAE